ncbi:MAG: TIGR01212 family radical SAM protein [Bacilli bacterium]
MAFKYSDTNKRYHTLDYFYKHKFNSKVFKISLNAGFSCPHLKSGGCIYCSNSGSGEYGGNVNDNLLVQFQQGVSMNHHKWPYGKYIGYFQARTNTFAPLNILKEKYELILKQDNVVGLAIATRPDCITDECLEYLDKLNKRTFLTIELGLQTIHSKTSILINRGHDLECFKTMVNKLRKKNINVVVHIINGLPYETKEMMIETVKYLNTLDIQGIKIHMLSILKNTALAKMDKDEILLNKDEYVEIVCTQLQYLKEEIVIHRLTGDPKKEDLIKPAWVTNKIDVLNSIDKYMAKNNIVQGQKCKNSN